MTDLWEYDSYRKEWLNHDTGVKIVGESLPALYEALENMVSGMRGDEERGPQAGTLPFVHDSEVIAARKALAEARGETP